MTRRSDTQMPKKPSFPALFLALSLTCAVSAGCVLPRVMTGSTVTRVHELTVDGAQLVQPGKETSLKVRLLAALTTQALSFTWTKAEITLSNPTLLNAPKTLQVSQAGGESISGEFTGLRPGSGYGLSITLYNGSTEVASGSNSSITLSSGANTVQVSVTPVGGGSGPLNLTYQVGTVVGDMDPLGVSAQSWPLKARYGAVRDSQGNYYFALSSSHQVLRLSPDGKLFKVAGSGFAQSLGDGGPASQASLNSPTSLGIDAADNLYISEYDPSKIRFIPATSGTYFGQSMTAGNIYTVAGSGGAIDPIDPKLSGSALASTMGYTTQIGADPTGNLFIAFHNTPSRVGVLARTTGTLFGQSVTAGNLYSFLGNNTLTSAPDGTAVWSSASVGAPTGINFDSAGNLFFSENQWGNVRMVPRTAGNYFGISMQANTLYTLMAGLQFPNTLALDPDGHIAVPSLGIRFRPRTATTLFGISMSPSTTYIVAGGSTTSPFVDGASAVGAAMDPRALVIDAQHNIVAADPTNNYVEMVPNVSGTYFGRSLTAGNVYAVAGNGTDRFSADGLPAATSVINTPNGIAVDADENLYFADGNNRRIRFVPKTSGTFFGQSMTAGNIYTLAGTGTSGYTPDVPAVPGTSAMISTVTGLWVDASRNVYLADSLNHRIRKISSNGMITTIAGTGTAGAATDGASAATSPITSPQSIVGDASGNLYFAEGAGTAPNGRRIRKIDNTGKISLIAGTGASLASTATEAALSTSFNLPRGLTIDGSGNLYVADQGGHVVRKISNGQITTVAGTGTFGSSGDGGNATSAQLRNPRSVALASDGSLLILDGGNNSVRHVALDGKISTLAGGLTNVAGYANSTTGTDARFGTSQAMAITPQNTLYLADGSNHRIRKLTPR